MVKPDNTDGQRPDDTAADAIREVLAKVRDPEIPVLTIVDLGILREVRRTRLADGRDGWRIALSPTYSGCPATDMIHQQVRMALYAAGVTDFEIETRLAPPWTTDWISAEGREKLRAYGIAPPDPWPGDGPVACPRCGDTDTALLSEFGSTPCKSLRQCRACLEPFDHFKCHGRAGKAFRIT